MTSFQLGDISTYDKYLNETFKLFSNIPLSDTERNVLIVRLYGATDTTPRVMISRRSFVHMDGNISFQDVLNIESEDKNVTLNAEFTSSGELINSPTWGEDPLFESITREIEALQNTPGSRLNVEVNYGERSRFISADGSWVSTGSILEGQRRKTKENI